MLVLELLFHHDRYGAKYLRYGQLHAELDATFIALGKTQISNSTFDYYIKCCKDRKLISHTHYKGESRFSATDRAISYIEELKIKKPDYADMKVVDMPIDATKKVPKRLVESWHVTDTVSRVVNASVDKVLSEISRIGPNPVNAKDKKRREELLSKFTYTKMGNYYVAKFKDED
jgi:hypothetical protein